MDAVGLKVGEELGIVVGVDDTVLVGKALTDGDWVGHPSPNRIEVSEDPNSPPSAMIRSS